MDPDDTNTLDSGQFYDEESRSAVNSCILDYYKKFGRKRDLEQYFSLSTAQGDICDPSGLFWRRMKTQYDSDSGEKKSESSTELCRVSIKCSIPVQSSGSKEEKLSKSTPSTESNSPPIITEEKSLKLNEADNDNSDDDSQKSVDNVLDSSVNKPPSPTSSINSQKKLEWDSLADVGYANEGDCKNSSSSLSTLERLALQQQYSNNENVKAEINVGVPTAQSTPIEEAQVNKSKTNNKNLIKSTKYYKKDVDYVQINVPQESNSTRPINVNLTKHISFNVDEKTRDMVQTSNHEEKLNTPKMTSVETVVAPELFDKEIQTSLMVYEDSQIDLPKTSDLLKPSKSKKKMPKSPRTPILIQLNTLRRYARNRKNRFHKKRINYKTKNYLFHKYSGSQQEKTAEPMSEAESFEYMPGHIYQNQNRNEQNQSKSSAGNKSSLESSSHLTESSKETNMSFTRDLEKSIDQLKKLVEKRQKNANFKNEIVKEIVQKLVRSKYKDDDSGTDFLSGFSVNSKLFDLGQGDNTTTSTSDQNNTAEKSKDKPRKSILRTDKLDCNVSSTMQHYPNSVNVLNKHSRTKLKLSKKTYSNSESDSSNKYSSEGVKTSSEELYLKYISAFKKEEEYKRYLTEKEAFLKRKLSSTSKHNKPKLKENMDSSKLNELLKDLATNNYNNGSGDAFKLIRKTDNIVEKENLNKELKTQKYHSVYTLSSGNSANVLCNHNTQKVDKNLSFSSIVPNKCEKEKFNEYKNDKNEGNCDSYCCLEHFLKAQNMADCSVQVDLPIKSQQKTCGVNTDQHCNNKANILPAHCISEKLTGELKYVCFCTKTEGRHTDMPDSLLIYKCSCLASEKTSENYAQPLKTDELQFRVYECANNLMTKNKDCCTLNRNSYILNKKIVASKSSQGNDVIPNLVDYKNTKDKKDNPEILEPKRELLNEHKIDLRNPMQTCDFGCSSGSAIKPSRCIQTDISIYPKTSDPTLSDLLTVDETAKGRECGVGVGLSLKKVYSITDNMAYSDVDSKFVEICSSKSKLSVSSGLSNEGGWRPQSGYEAKQDSKRTQKNVENLKPSQEKQSTFDEYMPISKENKVGQGVNTDIIDYCDKEISSYEECSKGIQCCTNEIFTQNLKTRDNSMEQLIPNKPEQNDNGALGDKIVDRNEIEFKCDSNNNDESDILHHQSKAITEFKEEHNIVRRLCSEIPEHIQRLTKCHTYPPSKNLSKGKNLTPTDTYNNKPKDINKKQSTDKKISKKLACLKLLNEVDSKESDIGKYSTVQTIKTEEVYTNNHSRKDRFYRKSNGEEANEELNEYIFERYQSEIANRDSLKESKSSGNTSKSSHTSLDSTKDPIMALIKSITKRYSKRELEKSNRKKCFKEIMFILNYLLDTDDSTDTDNLKRFTSVTTSDHISKVSDEIKLTSPGKKIVIDRATQFYKQTKSLKHSKKIFDNEESSDVPTSSDVQETPSESPAYEVLNRIKKECEKYQKRCKGSQNRKTEALSSTSVHCEQSKNKCNHKCKSHKHSKQSEKKSKRQCIAYNLIIQTSDSMIHEEPVYNKNQKPLQNIIVKVPSKPYHPKQANNVKSKNVPTEKHKVSQDTEEEQSYKTHQSKFMTNIGLSGESPFHGHETNTVSEYLERNRPDFLEKSLKRQNCLKVIKETRARERDAERLLLAELEVEAPEIAAQLRAFDGRLPISRQERIDTPKFASEREMKKHSERIYKTLPEVTRKKEELRKEKMRRTNLIMAHLFNKNLQKRTLKGVVNISNYSTIIKI